MSTLFVVRLSAVPEGHARYLDGMRYPILLYIRADDEDQIWVPAAEQLTECQWHEVQFERYGELQTPVAEIEDEVLRGAAEEASEEGFAFVVYDQAITSQQ
ncbi:hypothetical protein [Hoeflea sp. 108]|uniref:hypothetical protein n=1 Tax=Hoeflea sp. 108 TaxID=1116369 RepID=UPI0012FAC887|nr:hypothetical protein [Hoeflea sp. 108]